MTRRSSSAASVPTVLQRLAAAVPDPSGVAAGLVGPVGLELRQIAGLAAGASHPIPAAGIEYTGGPNGSGFRLDADADGHIVITPLKTPIRLDGRTIDGPTTVSDAVIDVGFAAFMVTQGRDAQLASHLQLDGPNRRVPEIGLGSDRRRRPSWTPGAPSSDVEPRSDAEPDTDAETDTDAGTEAKRGDEHSMNQAYVDVPAATDDEHQIIRLIELANEAATRRARASQLNPEEIIYRLFETSSQPWSASPSPAVTVPVAYGSMPWKPEMNREIEFSARGSSQLKTLSRLPMVPLVADLWNGPVGIAGNRTACLMIGAHLIVHTAYLVPPKRLSIGVVAEPARLSDWAWLDKLPHLAVQGRDPQPLRIVDNPQYFSSEAEVFVADDPLALPSGCGTVIIATDDLTCSYLDVTGDILVHEAVPIGLDPALAAAAADRMCHLMENPAVPTARPIDEPDESMRATTPGQSPIDTVPMAFDYTESFF